MALTKVSSGLISADASSVDLNIDAGTLYIDATNNRVGIGTTSPDTLLHLSATDGSAIVRLERNDTTIASSDVYGEIQFEGQDASAGSAAGIRGKILGVAEGATGEMALAFQTAASYSASTERMRIDSSGSVGVGTTSPSGGAVGGKVLHLVNSGGTASVRVDRSDSSTSGTISLLDSNSTHGLYGTGSKPMAFSTNSTERMRITTNGSVLIGTTTDVSESQLNGALKLGAGVNTGIGLKRLSVSSSATTVFDVSDFAPSDSSGDGLYMFNIVRAGGSYGTRFVGIFGVDNLAIALVETLESLGFTITVSGMNIQAAVSGSTVSCIATLQPLAIGE